jgi:hypothetical protein
VLVRHTIRLDEANAVVEEYRMWKIYTMQEPWKAGHGGGHGDVGSRCCRDGDAGSKTMKILNRDNSRISSFMSCHLLPDRWERIVVQVYNLGLHGFIWQTYEVGWGPSILTVCTNSDSSDCQFHIFRTCVVFTWYVPHIVMIVTML